MDRVRRKKPNSKWSWLYIPPSLYKDLVHPLKGNADAVTTGKPDWMGNPLGDLSARGTGNRLYIYISTGVSTILNLTNHIWAHIACHTAISTCIVESNARSTMFLLLQMYYSKHTFNLGQLSQGMNLRGYFSSIVVYRCVHLSIHYIVTIHLSLFTIIVFYYYSHLPIP